MYRSFHPPDGLSATDFFVGLLETISHAICRNCFVKGDFNLQGRNNLNQITPICFLPLNTLKNFAAKLNLIQVVDFNTWSRIINGNRKQPLLDHVYLNNHEIFESVHFKNPIFGDHVLVIVFFMLLPHR